MQSPRRIIGAQVPSHITRLRYVWRGFSEFIFILSAARNMRNISTVGF